MADWDISSPDDSGIVSQFPANERAARAAVMANFGVEHHETNDANIGKHERVTLLDLGSDPTIPAGQVGVYNVGGVLKTRSGGGAAVDVATETYVDNADAAHAALTAPHSATSAATANRLMLRDAAGRAQVADPSAAADIATKGYVDGSSSMAANGWVQLPGGLILQWGEVAVNGNTNTAVALPRTFPTAGLWGVAGYQGNTETSYTASVMALTTSQITVRSAGEKGKTLEWFALGY